MAAIIGTAVLMASCGNVTQVAQQDEQQLNQRVDELYGKMSQGERIAQLRSTYMDELFDANGNLDTIKCKQLIPYGIGHFSQYASQEMVDANFLRKRVAVVQDWLMHHTPNGIPALFHEEVLSGINTCGGTIYPQQIGQACSFNPELAELKTRQTSTDLRQMGGVLSLSPMVDVCRTPSFNRLEESYGEDSYLSAVMGTAFVNGLQQGDLKKGVGACSKHYLGYGGGGDANEKELMEEILLPHETMIRLAGSKALMPGYHAVHGTKCVANKELLIDILRKYLGFDGMVVSDYTAIDQIPGLDTPLQKAVAAINGGNDVDFPNGDNYKYLQEALDKGLVKKEVFERAVKDVLRYKFRAGLMDKNPYLYSKEDVKLDTKDDRQTAYDIASQSIVLLENNGILPLKKSNEMAENQNTETSKEKKILLTGPNANSIWAMCGDYSFPSMFYFWQGWKKKFDEKKLVPIVKLLDGMKANKPDGFQLQYSRGCDWTEEIETKFEEAGDKRAWEYQLLHRKVQAEDKVDKAEALAMAKNSDVIIAAVGENVMLCGENREREGLRLPGKQEEYVEELLATGKPVVLVVFGGRAQIISKIAKRCAAVIQAWYPGEEGGNALADILYGKVSPSAKLSVSYPNQEIHESVCYNYSDKPDPRIEWPFGYGLSYSTFLYKNLDMAKEIPTTQESTNIYFEVTNTGKVKSDEVAQVYLSPTQKGQNIRPIQLQGFARVSLNPGETKKVCVTFYTEQFGHYSRQGNKRQWNIVPGTYEIKIGASSQDIRLKQQIVLKGEKVVKPLRDHYFSRTL